MTNLQGNDYMWRVLALNLAFNCFPSVLKAKLRTFPSNFACLVLSAPLHGSPLHGSDMSTPFTEHATPGCHWQHRLPFLVINRVETEERWRDPHRKVVPGR